MVGKPLSIPFLLSKWHTPIPCNWINTYIFLGSQNFFIHVSYSTLCKVRMSKFIQVPTYHPKNTLI